MNLLSKQTRIRDIQSPESIRLLVDSFYTAVRQDELLGPVFEAQIKDWDAHLPTMYRFWEKLLLDKDGYEGNPFQKHLSLSVTQDHFTTWLELFTQTLDQNFAGPVTEKAKKLTRNIAATFQLRMGISPKNPEYAIPDYARP